MNSTRTTLKSLTSDTNVLNVTVTKYNNVYTNILLYSHDSNCFKLSASFIKTSGLDNKSFAFSFFFPIKPRVMVTLAGLQASKLTTETDNIIFQEIGPNAIFNDHFLVSVPTIPKEISYEMFQLCYYASVKVTDYIPPP